MSRPFRSYAQQYAKAINARPTKRPIRYTTRRRFSPAVLPYEVETDGFEFDPTLLARSAAYAGFAQRAAEDEVVVTRPQELAGRRVDQPELNTMAVMPSDEREAKREVPLVYFDQTPGEVPLMLVNNEGKHYEELRDKVAEMRHYREDEISDFEKPDTSEVFYTAQERAKAKQLGRHIFGAETRGMIDDEG